MYFTYHCNQLIYKIQLGKKDRLEEKDRYESRDLKLEKNLQTYKDELELMEPRESILVAAHNSLISEIRKNFL